MPVPRGLGQVGHPFRYLVVGNAVPSYGSCLALVARELFALPARCSGGSRPAASPGVTTPTGTRTGSGSGDVAGRGRPLGTAAVAQTAALGGVTLLCAALPGRLAPFSVPTPALGAAVAPAPAVLGLLVTVPVLAAKDPGHHPPHAYRPAPDSPSVTAAAG